MLYPATCVRLQVRVPVRLSLAGFLGSRITHLSALHEWSAVLRFGSGVLDCAPRRLHPSTRSSVCARRCHFSVAASPARAVTEYQPCLPSPSPFGLGLGPDLPRDDWHRPGNLGLAAGGVRAPLVVTHTYICLPGAPAWVALAFCAPGMLPYRYVLSISRAFGICLIPDYYPREPPRPVSCYALFE